MGVGSYRYGRLESWLAPFSILFTRPTWGRVMVLAAGAILTTHRRTVTAALRATGLARDPGFSRYHDFLSRSRWSPLAAARLLLGLLVAALVPSGPVVIGLDDTIERRWGTKIAARGIYRDPVRSSHGRQGERFALAVRYVAGADPVGAADLGSTVPDDAGAVGTVGTLSRCEAQDAGRWRSPDAPASCPVAA